MLFPTLSHNLGRLHRLNRTIERERRASASGTRLLRLQALLLQAKLRFAAAVAPQSAECFPVRVRSGAPR